MKTLQQSIAAEDSQAVVGRSNAGEKSLQIPNDLIFEILLRLPTKCIARCRCVSKLWASILVRQDFTDQYLKISFARPQLLLACIKDGKVSFFSAPQNQVEDNPSSITARYQMSFLVNDFKVKEIYSPINGLVCIRAERFLNGMQTVLVVCNPSTGESFTLPRMKTREKKAHASSFFGYDPIEKQFKVLSVIFPRYRLDWLIQAPSTEHQVLTLQAGKLSWRMIECGVRHQPGPNSVCINGVLYYNNTLNGYRDNIVSFDVRSEKFSVIKVTEPLRPAAVLVNFNGKLASVLPTGFTFFCRETTSFEMWVLDDIEKEEWSKHIYQLPPTWGNVVADTNLHCFKVTASNEVVWPQSYLQHSPFYVIYYHLERQTIRRVEIQGMAAFMNHRVCTFADHVEDVKLMKGVLGLTGLLSE